MLPFLLIGLPIASWAACSTPVCDSFDSYTGAILNGQAYGPNNLTASVANNRGSPINASIDQFAWSPPGSLHITCTAANQTNALLNYNNMSGWPQVFGRAMVFYSNASGARVPTNVHSWIFNAAGDNDYFATHNDTSVNATAPRPTVSMNLIVGGGGGRVSLNYHWSTAEAGASSLANQTIQPGNWYCVQWHYDGPNSGAKVWVDGQLWINVTHNKSWTGYTPTNSNQWRFPNKPGWNKMQFGFTHYQTLSSPVSLYLDDFALDTQMTCCPCQAGDTRAHCCNNFVPPTASPQAPTAPTNGASTAPTAFTTPTGNSTSANSGTSIAIPAAIILSLMSLV